MVVAAAVGEHRDHEGKFYILHRNVLEHNFQIDVKEAMSGGGDSDDDVMN